MAVVTRLTDDEVRAIAEAVLSRELKDAGFDHAVVTSGLDDDGDPALFITAVLDSQAPVLAGRTLAQVHGALNDGLLYQGEDRFPHLRLLRPGDEIPGDGPMDVSP